MFFSRQLRSMASFIKWSNSNDRVAEAIVLKNSRFFVTAGIAIAIAAAGHVTQVSAQATSYQPPAKRVSPAEGFARRLCSVLWWSRN